MVQTNDVNVMYNCMHGFKIEQIWGEIRNSRTVYMPCYRLPKLEIHKAVLKSMKVKLKMKVKSLSHVRLFATPWNAGSQAPPSMGFSRQEYWRGLPFPKLEIHKAIYCILKSIPIIKIETNGSWFMTDCFWGKWGRI